MRQGRAHNLALLALAAATAPAFAQPSEPAPEPDLPSLDDLLGLDERDGADTNDAALDRQLSAQQAGEKFQQAVGLMGDVADRIDASGDLSVRTQRIQEDILRKLDQVIEAAQQNQSGGGGSSSSSSSQDQQQQQQSDQSSQTNAQGETGSEPGSSNMPGSSTDTQLNPGVAPDGVTWGNLPDRERDAVSQGVTDRYSSLYRRLTELYYRKLAEQDADE